MKWQSMQGSSLVRVEGNYITSRGRNERQQVNNGAALAETGAKRNNMTLNRTPLTDRHQRVLRAKRKGISLHNAQALPSPQMRKTNRG